MALTAKQTAYVAARISGKGPSDAYRAAYNAAKLSPSVVSVKAAEVERHGTISVAIAEASRKALESAGLTREMYVAAQKRIHDRFADADDAKSVAVASQALERAAKAAGLLTDKVEHSGEQTVRVVRE